MNVQEMHIEINMSLQKIRSNYYRKIQDSEIDWLLNKHTDRFIKDRIKQDTDSMGFDATEVDMDALRTIIRLDRELPTFQTDLESIRAELPGNYSFMVDDFSYTIDKCDTVAYAASTAIVPTTIWLYTFPVNASAAPSPGPYYQAMNVTLNGSVVFDVSGLTGLETAEELFTARDYILHQLYLNRPDNVDFYWERFGDYIKKNSIIAVSSDRQTGSNTITIDGTTITAVEGSVTRDIIPESNNGKLCNNRLVRGHYRSNLRSSAFAKTTSTSPISAITGNQIKVYHDGKFIVSKLRVSYIRKPARISLFLNQDSDLAPEFHQEICDRVTLYIKEIINSPDWEVKLKDMMMNKD